METPLSTGEILVHAGAANMQRGIETVGGHLYLTTHRLVFEAHALNVQTGTTIVDVADVESMSKVWTRFLGVIPIAPNTLSVRIRDGQDLRFVLFGRDEWMRRIGEQADARRPARGVEPPPSE